MVATQIAATLRRARQSLGLTQREAAARAEVSHRLWSEVERGERPNVSLETAVRMLGHVGVTLRLADASGATTDVRDPSFEAAARAARAAVRRATWTGRVIRLEDDHDAPMPTRAERIAAVSQVTRQAHAIAELPRSAPAQNRRRPTRASAARE